MKRKYAVVISLMMALLSFSAFAQKEQHQSDRPGPDRIRGFMKMRLIETLKLNEEDAARYVAKQSSHEEKMQTLMRTRNELVDGLDSLIQKKAETSGLQSRVEQILENDQKMFTERRRYQDELRKLFTPEQFANFLVFERNFERHMREAMQDMGRGRGRSDN
jgi:hypothetical protein